MPRVSVIIPVYNGAKFIAVTLDSILTQTFQDFEVIVIDDGSTDNTAELVSRYRSPVKLIRNGRMGKSASRNTGIRAAKGQLIAFVDADDLWMPQKLEVQIQHLDCHPNLKWSYSNCCIFEDNPNNVIEIAIKNADKSYSGDVLRPLLIRDFVPSPTPIVFRDVFDEVGYFDETFLRHQPEDWDMWLRIAARYPVGLIDEPLALLRKHDNSLTAKEEPLKTFEGVIHVIQLAISRNQERLGGMKNKAISFRYVIFGKDLVRRGIFGEAQAMFINAIRSNPFMLQAYLYYLISLLLTKKMIDLSYKSITFWRKTRSKRIMFKSGQRFWGSKK
jgi:glycosyltransferase involved in cell wall biosynthesis